jgi:predicted membrane-bound spermidine synthase
MNKIVYKKSSISALLLLVAFIEGGLLMVTELVAARTMAPLFGSSVFVWGIVLSITLLALSIGYFLGSLYFSRIKNKIRFLSSLLLLVGLFLVIIPWIGKVQIALCNNLSFHVALVVSAFLLLVMPVILCGIISPTLVGLMHDHQKGHASNSAGRIYAISTLGGVALTLLTAYILLPEWGIRFTCVLIGLLTVAIASAILIISNAANKILVGLLGVTIVFIGLNQIKPFRIQSNGSYKTFRVSEGIMGQILVADFPTLSEGQLASERHLFVNGIIQTSYIPNNPNLNNHAYFKGIESVLSRLPQKSPILILGLGGGILANYSQSLGLKVDAVELDQRIVDCARTYFGLHPDVSVFTQDARGFIRTCQKKYACILIDLFRGEEPPTYFFTSESFSCMNSLLLTDGVILMNSNGYFSDEIGAGNRAILKTIQANGLKTKVFNSSSLEANSSMIILAAREASALELKVDDPFIQVNPEITADDDLLTDDRPVFDLLNQHAALEWRKGYLQYLLPLYEQNKIPLIF